MRASPWVPLSRSDLPGPSLLGEKSPQTKTWQLRDKGGSGAQGQNTVTPWARRNQRSPTTVAMKPWTKGKGEAGGAQDHGGRHVRQVRSTVESGRSGLFLWGGECLPALPADNNLSAHRTIWWKHLTLRLHIGKGKGVEKELYVILRTP